MRSTVFALFASLGVASPAQADLKLVADIPPVHSLLAQVVGDVGKVDLLLSGAVSPHDFALRPSQAQLLSDADAIVWVGEGLTPQLAGAIETLGAEANVITLSDVPDILHRTRREEAVFAEDDHKDDHGHSHEHDHEHSDDDPHLWLDPANAEVWLAALADRLGRLDPSNADVFTANAERAIEDLRSMAEGVTVDLAAKKPSFVVAHDALIHFESRFGVAAIGALSDSDAADPGPRRVAVLKQALEDQSVRCILIDVSEPSDLASSLGGEETKVLEIDPLGQRLTPGIGLYGDVIRDLAAKLAECGVE